jgi:hypothetical protein
VIAIAPVRASNIYIVRLATIFALELPAKRRRTEVAARSWAANAVGRQTPFPLWIRPGGKAMTTFLIVLGVSALVVLSVYLFVIEPRSKIHDL